MPSLEGRAFEVENALVLYATNFALMPAIALYDDELLRPHLRQMAEFHIYMIGLVPKVEFAGAEQRDSELVASFSVGSGTREVRWSPPLGTAIVSGPPMQLCIQHNSEEWLLSVEDLMYERLHKIDKAVDFKVLYVGQAYGLDGARNALDRLKKHETLQKIAVKGVPDEYNLAILMLSIELGTDLVTMFNLTAKDRSTSFERFSNGLEKLHNTTDNERITLYEAGMI